MDRRVIGARLAAEARSILATGPAVAVGGAFGMAAFGPVGAVAGGATSLVAMHWSSRGGSALQMLLNRTKIDYHRALGDPTKNSIVAAVVGWIARNFPEAPVRVGIQDAAGNITYIPRAATGPGFMVGLLERPNRWFSGALMWKAVIVDLFCHGNAYLLKVRSTSGRVVQLWYAPAKTMRPCWPENDSSVFIGWYEYRPGDGKVYELRPQDVVHFRDGIDPTNTRLGLSKIGSLLREIFTDDEASNFTAVLIKNLGVPGVVLAPANTTAGGFGSITDPDKVKATFAERFGGDHRGEPMVMTQPTDIKVLSWNPQQMDLKALRRIPEERISGVLGIAAVVAGLGAGLDRSTFTNYGEARKAAYEEAVIPTQKEIAAEILVQMLPEWADTESDNYVVEFDITHVRALQEAVADVWRRAESAATKGLLKRAEFKRLVGLTPAADGSDEVYVYPNNYTVFDPEAGAIVPGSGGGNSPAGPSTRNPSTPAAEAPIEGVAA
jgi:HK97 family phage portal protein